ncbi:NLPA lipoprotein [Denitrovibrio acetiphilus DSM 12809]|uniref:Lipoprotein n=1 Tax=Denitrovibrio acetiphilus (strain DSM 12809 / NBRC 114555 / N2460) TaxID=522772 RepID=D4H1T2_DENA2|nr:MetQ/NlpA family ABC transporter substrate-binding protein [Denitrovibrio acetiphilus]ADD68842.1 NLPA lipoprotein [Denitrovibrio acetiphilus DSM 12809]
MKHNKVLTTVLTVLLVLVGVSGYCETGEKTVLKVGATPVPHTEILEYIKPMLEKEGIELKIISFTDYVQPNLALDRGELDANFFQHIPYLESFSRDHNLNLSVAAKVHIEPIGVYSRKVSNIADLRKRAIVAIPNDPSNAGRALALLAKAKLITLKDGAGVSATVQDIVDNPKKLKVKALDAAQLPRVLADVDAAVINTNYALEGNLNPLKDAIFIEDKDSPYSNILVVRKVDFDKPALRKLAEILVSPAVEKFITEKYKGAILPAQELMK